MQPGLNLIQIERWGGGGVVKVNNFKKRREMEHAAASSLHFMLGKNYKLLLWQKQKK